MGNKIPKEAQDYMEMNVDTALNSKGEQQQFQQCWPSLTYKQRAIGWITCAVIGFILSISGTITLAVSDNIIAFAVMYSIGQIINIMGSCFLSTPKGQWIAMKDKKRRVASILYILSIIITLVMALVTKVKGVVYFFLVLQMLAYYWYSLSFFPWGQKMLQKCCCFCFK